MEGNHERIDEIEFMIPLELFYKVICNYASGIFIRESNFWIQYNGVGVLNKRISIVG